MVIGTAPPRRLHGDTGDGFANLLCTGKCVGRIAIVQDHQKLLTAIAAYEIIRSHGREQPLCCFPQDIITGEMAVGIIHTLEIIQIAHQNCCRDSLAPGTIVRSSSPQTRTPSSAFNSGRLANHIGRT